jgi:hypothetical protein
MISLLMPIARYGSVAKLLSTTVGCLLMSQMTVAQDFPTLSPKLQPQLNAAASEFTAARNNLQQRFAWPTGVSAPMPCEGVTTELHRLGGVIPQDDETTKKAYARAARQAGMVAGASKPPQFIARQLHIVKAQCQQGKLDGEVEGWLDYDMILDSDAVLMVTNYRTHFKARYETGKPRHQHNLSARWQIGSKNTYKDPATEKLMAGMKSPNIQVAIFASDSDHANISVMYMVMNGKSSLKTTVVDIESLPPKLRTTMRMYQLAQLTSEGRMRDGHYHGWMTMYPHTDMMLGVQIPGSKTCYDEGEMIKSNTCDVD